MSSYAFAVHRDVRAASELAAERVSLLAYRDDGDRVRYLELSPAAFAILERMIQGSATVREAIAQGLEASCIPVDDAALAGTASLLSELAERGVLLGTRVEA